MTPPSPFQPIDTLTEARRYFRLGSNKLDYLGELLVGEGKTETTYKDCWWGMLNGDDKTKKRLSKQMKIYCQQDVALLEKIYEKFLPWATNRPNLALEAGHDFVCPRCLESADFKVKSYRRTRVRTSAVQLQCKKCGGYVTRLLTPEEKEELASTGRLASIYRNTI